MPPQIPDFQIGDAAWAAAINQEKRAIRGYGWLAGDAVDPGPGLAVTVPSDTEMWIDGSDVEVQAGENVPPLEAHDRWPRWASIVVNADGTCDAILGDPDRPPEVGGERLARRNAPIPAPPIVDDPDSTLHSFVWIPANADEVTEDDIVDRRLDARLDAFNLMLPPYSDAEAVDAVQSEDPMSFPNPVEFGDTATATADVVREPDADRLHYFTRAIPWSPAENESAVLLLAENSAAGQRIAGRITAFRAESSSSPRTITLDVAFSTDDTGSPAAMSLNVLGDYSGLDTPDFVEFEDVGGDTYYGIRFTGSDSSIYPHVATFTGVASEANAAPTLEAIPLANGTIQSEFDPTGTFSVSAGSFELTGDTTIENDLTINGDTLTIGDATLYAQTGGYDSDGLNFGNGTVFSHGDGWSTAYAYSADGATGFRVRNHANDPSDLLRVHQDGSVEVLDGPMSVTGEITEFGDRVATRTWVNDNTGDGGGSVDPGQRPNLHVPTTEIPAGDFAEMDVRIRTSDTISAYTWGLNTDVTGVELRAHNKGTGSQIASTTSGLATGDPVFSHDGTDGVENWIAFRIANTTTSAITASAFAAYEITDGSN